MLENEQIRANINSIKNSLPGNVALCAVSKFHTVDEIKAAIEAGQTLFGENRVQEAYEKFSELRKDPSITADIKLHIIGQLQSNKVKKAVEIADCIQSVDRIELLEKIEKACQNLDKTIDVYLEVHTGEESKSGFSCDAELMECIKKLNDGLFPHVRLSGLMTMAPFTDNECLIRQSFSKLRNLKEKINEIYSKDLIQNLSMGMSGDYRIAIEEGSSMVRIGTAIFGIRNNI